MKENTKSYEELKQSFWQFTQKFRGHAKFSKGDARAYVSSLVWLHEKRLVSSENFSQEFVHEKALMQSLEHTRRCREKGIEYLINDYKSALTKWREEYKNEKIKGQKTRQGGPHKNFLVSDGGNKDYKRKFTVISLFTGAFGLDTGFEYEGFRVMAGLDIDSFSAKTVKANRPTLPFINKDIADVSTEEILEAANLKLGEVDVLTGGPPCQPFSPAGKRQSLRDPRASPLLHFVRVIHELQPKVFVMEEVPGLLSARICHVPWKERNKKTLTTEEQPGSAFRVVMEQLRKTKYNLKWDVLNAADYGTPQVRKRVIIIGRREGNAIPLPEPLYSNVVRETLLHEHSKPWLTLWEALRGLNTDLEYTPLPPKYAKFMVFIPPGGNWRQLPDDVKPEAMGGAYKAEGGRMGFYRRLCWDEPAPTLVTSPTTKGSIFVHPEEDRALSIEEYKRIQGFPDDFILVGGLNVKYRLVGDAVPIPLSRAIAREVYKSLNRGCL